jgi:hypothetical protein
LFIYNNFFCWIQNNDFFFSLISSKTDKVFWNWYVVKKWILIRQYNPLLNSLEYTSVKWMAAKDTMWLSVIIFSPILLLLNRWWHRNYYRPATCHCKRLLRLLSFSNALLEDFPSPGPLWYGFWAILLFFWLFNIT